MWRRGACHVLPLHQLQAPYLPKALLSSSQRPPLAILIPEYVQESHSPPRGGVLPEDVSVGEEVDREEAVQMRSCRSVSVLVPRQGVDYCWPCPLRDAFWGEDLS